MKFLLLLHGDADAEAALTADQRRTIVDEHLRFRALLTERGAIILGEALEPPEAARTIRLNGGEAIVTDGPFVEAKEAVGGFYILQAESIDAAVELAKRAPRSPGLVVELLPIAEM
jgi:hypothetical protein